MTSETPAKLPVWKTATESFRLTFQHLGDLLRFAWPWLLLLIAVSCALYWGLYPVEKAALAETGSGSNLLWISTLFVSTMIGAFIAVPWHRMLLLGEKNDLSASGHFASRKWRYALRALLMIALPMLPILALIQFYPATSSEEAATTADSIDLVAMMLPVVYFGSFIALMVLVNRMSLILPATALDHNDVGWVETWSITRGNTWRLFWSSFIVSMPLILVAIGYVIHDLWVPVEPIKIAEVNEIANRTRFTLWSVGWELAAMLFGILYVTFLSLAYRHFTGLAAPESTIATPAAP